MLDSQKLDYILANMATKDDIANMATKDDIANMATKDDLAELESNLLTEIDTVQEKANDHFARMERRLDLLTSTVNVIDLEYKNGNLLAKAIIDLQHRVDAIELRIS